MKRALILPIALIMLGLLAAAWRPAPEVPVGAVIAWQPNDAHCIYSSAAPEGCGLPSGWEIYRAWVDADDGGYYAFVHPYGDPRLILIIRR